MISLHLLPQRMTIRRNDSETVRPTGTVVKGLTEVATGVPFSVQPNRDMVDRRNQGRQRLGDWLGFCRQGVDVQQTDQLEDESSGELYEVLGVFDSAGRGHHQELDLELDRRT